MGSLHAVACENQMENAVTGGATAKTEPNLKSEGSSTGDKTPQVGPVLMASTVPRLEVNVVVLQVGGAVVFSGILFILIVVSFSFFSTVADGGLIALTLMPYFLLAASVAIAGVIFFACRNQHLGTGENVFNWCIANIYGIFLASVTWGSLDYLMGSAETVLTVSLIQMLVGSLLIFLAVP